MLLSLLLSFFLILCDHFIQRLCAKVLIDCKLLYASYNCTCCPVKTKTCRKCESHYDWDQRHRICHGIHRTCHRVVLICRSCIWLKLHTDKLSQTCKNRNQYCKDHSDDRTVMKCCCQLSEWLLTDIDSKETVQVSYLVHRLMSKIRNTRDLI